MTLVETTRLLASSCETTGLAVFVDCLDNPVDARIATDGFVLWVDKDDLEVFVGRVLVDPVRVKDSQVGTSASDTLLGSRLQGSLVLQLVDTLVDRFAYGSERQVCTSIRIEVFRTVSSTLW